MDFIHRFLDPGDSPQPLGFGAHTWRKRKHSLVVDGRSPVLCDETYHKLSRNVDDGKPSLHRFIATAARELPDEFLE